MLLFERRFTEDGKCEKLYIRVTYAADLPKREIPNIRKLNNHNILLK